MCTLRNFPQITDHCIEWARDQFALLFTKLIKNTEMYLKTPDLFHEEMKGLSDTAQAIFIIRSVTSITRAIANPVIQQLTQVAFDIFHFLFRDRILDLQNTFPMDKRIIDKNGVDKGPFWGEKKRYPATAGFNIDDETHTSFIISTSCLLGSCIGAIPVKTEDDDTWCASYREPSFIQEMVPLLKVPEYVFSPVNTSDGADDEDASNSAATATAKKEELINRLLDQLHDASTTIKSSPVAIFADFEKDDDYNFHIAFVTAAANLRCDNYFIKRTNFHSCKVIAGKIIAAIATTTAAVCGLVILELFKLLQGKPTDSYMNRQIGLATNTYTSFTAENPIKLITTTEKTPPAAEETTPDMYDEQGKIKDEFIVKTVKRSYPENHTIWDKLLVPGTLTLKQFADWLSTTHNLKLLSWDFIIGYKMGVDEDGKKTGLVGVSSPVFPPKAVLDPSLLPALDLTLPQATQAIMRTATAKPTQEYIKLWKECKVSGKVDIEGILRQQTDVITNDTTLVQILEKMEKLGIIALQEKRVESRSITGLDKRTFWIIPSNESPRCMVVDTEDEVEHLASIKIQLSPTNF